MLEPTDLYEYQRECIQHQLHHDDSMLWLQMGLGKTPVTLTTIADRMRAGLVQKTLIFGPLRVIQAVWAREARKWSHTRHLRFSVLHGSREKRSRALFAEADIYLINYEAMNWLAQELDHYYLSQGKPLPFQMVVYDEVSKLKNSTTLRMAGGSRDRTDGQGDTVKIKLTGWRKMIPHFAYRTGLTGTPASNGYLDLHGQFLAVDGGERLGTHITHFKDSYFTSDFNGWNYSPTELGQQCIESKISDIVKKMDAADYLDTPEVKVTNMLVKIPPKARKAYDEVEKNMFAVLDSGTEVEVFSRSSVSNKCLQFCNGSPYLSSESSEFEAVHDAKLDALEEVLEEAAGSPVLCSYTFKADADRILKRFKKYRPVNMTATASKDTESVINKWNKGEIRLMIGHPACLHPDTLVLTELRGWVRLIEVRQWDRVFDGVEFVSHSGCSYSGYSEVLDTLGFTMTPDHRVLIDNEWVEAADVSDCEDTRRKASYEYEGDDEYLSAMCPLQWGERDPSPECQEAQPPAEVSLSTVCGRARSRAYRDSDIPDMEWHEEPRAGSLRRRLRGAWDTAVLRVGGLSEFLPGHGSGVPRRLDDRTGGRERPLLDVQLHLGDDARAAVQQKEHAPLSLLGATNAPRGAVPSDGPQQDAPGDEAEPRHVARGCGGRRKKLSLREEHQPCERPATRKAHVYDLVDCGPRHRFVIKNPEGQVFISHNSMGHGIDGLQDSGSILVWFGLNWSLELYEQMNGRLDRNGQKSTVSVIRILCEDSVDLAVADALERKTDDQEGLKSAIQRYRDGFTTNELEVNFF